MEDCVKSISLSIGGHVVSVDGKEAAYFAQSGAFARFVTNEAEAEWQVHYGMQVDAQPVDALLLSSFVYEEIGSRCLFYNSGDDYYFTMLPNSGGQPLAVMRYRRDSSIVESSSVGDPNALRFSLWFAISMLVTPSQLTFVHSSTIVYKGHAVLFLGESGTGKSTHTRLWLNNIEGAHLLNDDSPLIQVNNSILVYGSPWSGKTPCYIPRHYPLAAIVRLSQAPHNAIRRLSIPQAFAALQPSLPPALVQDEYYADLIVDIISRTISNVPVYHLECLPNAHAARLSFETIFPLSDG